VTFDELQNLVARRESETLEFKRTTSETTRGMHAGCGMLNGKGGRVLFGVDDRGRIVGQPIGHDSLLGLADEAKHLDPPVAPDIETVEVAPGKDVIIVTFEPGARRPYTYKGRAFKRVGESTVELPREQYNKLLLEQMHGTERWESAPAPEWTVDDLDGDEVLKTLDEAIRRGRLSDPGRAI